MDVRTDLHRIVDAVLGDDPRDALIAYRRLTAEHVPWLEERVVRLARRESWTWARIARLLGRSRQAVRQKFPDNLRPSRRAPTRAEYAELERRRREREIAAYQREHDYLAAGSPDGDDDVVAW